MARQPVRSIQSIGKSLVVCIPSEMCRDMDVQKGDLIRFTKKCGLVVISKEKIG